MPSAVKTSEPQVPSRAEPDLAAGTGRRRQPVQVRSRETVERILEAAVVLIEEGGVEAVTTRAIAERAGITAPSIYRFFADREQVLDALIELHLERLSEFLAEREAAWTLSSLSELVERELGSYVTYFRSYPNAARLWLDGRASPTVRAEVRNYHLQTAQRLRDIAVAAGLVHPQADQLVFVMMVELGDRTLELAFRDRSDPDPEVVRQGGLAITSYLQAALTP